MERIIGIKQIGGIDFSQPATRMWRRPRFFAGTHFAQLCSELTFINDVYPRRLSNVEGLQLEGFAMKSVVLLSASALIVSAFFSTASAQRSNAPKSKREQAVATCIAQAQQQIPSSGNPNDPGFNNRYNVYANCMKSKGVRP